MAATLETRLARLEAEIIVAWAMVLDARRRWAHSPNGDTIRAADEALAEVDGLLDEYLGLRS